MNQQLTPMERVTLARLPQRPNAMYYIDALLTDFYPLKGDRLSKEDASVIGGIGRFHEIPVTVLANRKGATLEDNLTYNFGMSLPSGYRKVMRLAKQAEKFNRPIITFIDTPGAYPGIEAEMQGQGEAIAQCLALFSDLTVPVISIIIGEGGSGGALALGVSDHMIMLEHAIYSILSPEGFASILWKDASRKEEAAKIMKLTSYDLEQLGVVDTIIAEGEGSVIDHPDYVVGQLDTILQQQLMLLQPLEPSVLIHQRYQKFRKLGTITTY
ncbi:MAG: acetyl-CoA carboxylase carboxyltransferase subunit alpha [Eubacteriales bacterium]